MGIVEQLINNNPNNMIDMELLSILGIKNLINLGVVNRQNIGMWLTQMGVSINGVPPNGWFIRANPIKMDDDWGYLYFRKLESCFFLSLVSVVFVES